jgi:hypothetical protein
MLDDDAMRAMSVGLRDDEADGDDLHFTDHVYRHIRSLIYVCLGGGEVLANIYSCVGLVCTNVHDESSDSIL